MVKKTDNTYKIIEFIPEYREQVIDLIDKSLRELKVIPLDDERVDDEDLFHIPEVYSGKGRFWVSLDNSGKVVGMVAIRDLGNNEAKLNRMFIESKLYGTGLGQRLLDKAIDFAKQQNFKEIKLNTHHLMKRAHHFYEKNGFQRTGEGKDKYFYKLKL